MKDLVGIASSFPAQRSLETGNPLNQTNLEEMAQSAANRAEFLKAQVDDFNATGAKKIRVALTTAAMKALASPPAGQVAFCAQTSAFGLYYFVAGSTVASDVPGFFYNHDSVLGHWKSALGQLLVMGGAGNAERRLDPQTLLVPNRILEIVDLVEGSPTTRSVGSANAWQDSGMATGNISLQVGDKVSLRFTSSLSAGEAIDVKVRLSVAAPSGNAGLDGSEVVVDTLASSKRMAVATQGIWTATEAGNHVFKVQLYAPLSGGPYTAYLHAHRSLQGLVIRP